MTSSRLVFELQVFLVQGLKRERQTAAADAAEKRAKVATAAAAD